RPRHAAQERPHRELPARGGADGRCHELAQPLPAFLERPARPPCSLCGERTMPASPSPDVAQKPSLTLKRRLNAPAEKVYTAWTRPEQITKWFGPSDTSEVIRAETDVRVGGRYTLAFRTEDGEDHQ